MNLYEIAFTDGADQENRVPISFRVSGDPDGNGVELYWDRPREQWPKTPDGGLNMITEPLDVEELLKDAPDNLKG